MAKQTTMFRCMLISPSDVEEERKAVIDAIEKWNTTIGLGLGAHVATTRWETAAPAMGACRSPPRAMSPT